MPASRGGSVEGVGVVVLAEDSAPVDAVLEDVRPDLRGCLRPCGRQVSFAADVRQLRRAVEGHPAHQLRRDVVLRLAARLPYALVGLTPYLCGALRLGLHERPQAGGGSPAVTAVEQDRVEGSAEDVILPLVERAVADANGVCAFVAGQLLAHRFGQIAAAVDAVHDLEGAVVVALDVGHELHELVGLPIEEQVVERPQQERPSRGASCSGSPSSARRQASPAARS